MQCVHIADDCENKDTKNVKHKTEALFQGVITSMWQHEIFFLAKRH